MPISPALARRLHGHWRRNLYLALSHRYAGDDAARLAELARLARDAGIRPLATNDVHYHHPDRRPLQDVLTCIREHVRIADAAPLLYANAERHLKPPDEMARLFRDHPDALESTLEIVERCRFSLRELAYDYPTQRQLRRPHAGRGAGPPHLGGRTRTLSRTGCRRRSTS